ncbi:MAG: hypothetical protein QX190_02330, partial [Methylococcales bacterium]
LTFAKYNAMSHFTELSTLLNQHFHWNKARMDCLVSMVIALFFQGDDKLKQTRQSLSEFSEVRV